MSDLLALYEIEFLIQKQFWWFLCHWAEQRTDTKADGIPKILFSVLPLPLAVLLNEVAVTSPTSAAKLTTFEESFSASLPFFEAMQECKSPLLLMPPWLMQRFFNAGWGGGRESSAARLQWWAREGKLSNVPQVFCGKEFGVRRKSAPWERGGVCKIWERSALSRLE